MLHLDFANLWICCSAASLVLPGYNLVSSALRLALATLISICLSQSYTFEALQLTSILESLKLGILLALPYLLSFLLLQALAGVIDLARSVSNSTNVDPISLQNFGIFEQLLQVPFFMSLLMANVVERIVSSLLRLAITATASSGLRIPIKYSELLKQLGQEFYLYMLLLGGIVCVFVLLDLFQAICSKFLKVPLANSELMLFKGLACCQFWYLLAGGGIE